MTILKSILKKLSIYKKLNHQFERDDFVINELKKILPNSLILDAGSGSQRYRDYCAHLIYKTQDFGQYKVDQKKMIGSDGAGGLTGYKYGHLDYIGDVWDINEKAKTFDAVLCTEVIEHIPYPNETIKEFSRLLKPGGKLILTAPANSWRHMDPYFFYSGFSDRWYEKFLLDNGFVPEKIIPVGDYYSFLSVEIARTAISHSFISKIALAPAFIYFYTKKKTRDSISTMCKGYHVVAHKA